MKTLHLTLKMTTAQVVKHLQSPTTVFLKTTLTWMITQDKQLILLGSNHLPLIIFLGVLFSGP